MRLIFLTRTYALNSSTINCTGYRNYAVDLLKKQYDVLVITPGYDLNAVFDSDGVISLPYRFKRSDMWLERVGIYEDYLKRWVDESLEYLDGRIFPDDILLAVSGGELGSIMLASKLKQRVGCKLITWFHDPIDATTVNGKKSTYRIHINRDRLLLKYLSKADEIITCSKTYKCVLDKLINSGERAITNIYLGFRGGLEHDISHTICNPLRVVYAGTMTPTQGAERFIDLLSDRKDIELIFIGQASKAVCDLSRNKPNVRLIPPIPHEEFLDYMKNKTDIGLVALDGDEFGACVPSKIYELINLEVPIFALLPDGDAKRIINDKYGYACSGKNKKEANELFTRLLDPKKYDSIVLNMKTDKSQWQMDMLFKEVFSVIDRLR